MRKFAKIAAVMTLAAALLTGCGGAGDAGNATDSGTTTATVAEGEGTTEADTSLQDIQSKGELKLGLDASFPPMGFTDEDLNIVGFDIDLAQEVCSRMGVKLSTASINWDAKEQELATKNVDCLWNGLSYNEDRAKSMTLSDPYMENKQVAVVLTKSPIKKLSDLKDKTVAIQNGSTASDAMKEHPEVTDSLKELIKVKDNIKALMDMKVNASDCVVMDEVVARYYLEKEPDTYRLLDESLSNENYVIGFRKGDEALKDEVQKQLSAMKEDGTLAKIAEKWFGKDLTTVK